MHEWRRIAFVKCVRRRPEACRAFSVSPLVYVRCLGVLCRAPPPARSALHIACRRISFVWGDT